MLALTRLLMFVPLALAARIRRIERRTLARLRDAGADTAEWAILLARGGRLDAWVQRRLGRAGALVGVENDRYYLNPAAYDGFCRRRRQRALAVAGVVAGIGVWLYFKGALS